MIESFLNGDVRLHFRLQRFRIPLGDELLAFLQVFGVTGRLFLRLLFGWVRALFICTSILRDGGGRDATYRRQVRMPQQQHDAFLSFELDAQLLHGLRADRLHKAILAAENVPVDGFLEEIDECWAHLWVLFTRNANSFGTGDFLFFSH